jgi:hypothetical protein
MPDRYVFRVRCDTERFGAFSCTIEGDVPEVFRFRNGVFVEHWWLAPLVRFSHDDVRPDIWRIAETRMFVMASEVAERLMPLVTIAGELLPLRTETDSQREFVALNVTNAVDAINVERSATSSAAIYPDFVAHRLGEPTFFIIPRLDRAIFCLERDDTDDSLMGRLRSQGLTGLCFDEVWSSKDGARHVNLAADVEPPGNS